MIIRFYAFMATCVLVFHIVNGVTTEIIQETVYGTMHMVKRQNAQLGMYVIILNMAFTYTCTYMYKHICNILLEDVTNIVIVIT